MTMERDYVLGTHDEELARLGLQHRVWRRVVLDCWEKAPRLIMTVFVENSDTAFPQRGSQFLDQ